MKIKTDNGKYTFTSDACVIRILRHGEQWHEQEDASNAIASLMYELDAARVVLEVARNLCVDPSAPAPLRLALQRHDALVDDREPPSEWAAVD